MLQRLPNGVFLALLVQLAACSAPREAADAACGEGEVAAGGDCVPDACGNDVWSTASGPAFHVAPDGASDGDGSETRPFSGIQDAADAAARAGGGTVLLAAGTYAGHVTLGSEHDGVDLVGRCPELVTLDGGEDDAPVVAVEKTGAARPTVALRGLTLQGGRLGGVQSTRGLTTLQDVVIRDVGWIGVYGSGGSVTLRRVAVGPIAMEESSGRGVHLASGVEALLEDVTVDAAEDFGVYASDRGTHATLRRVAVRGTRAGVGLYLDVHAAGVAERLELDANGYTGLQIMNEATLIMMESVVRGTVADARGRFGDGVVLAAGGVATFRDVRVEGNARNAILVRDPASSLTMEGGTITANRTAGLVVDFAGAAHLTATPITENAGVGVTSRNAGSRVTLDALEIRGTYPTEQATDGIGAVAYDGGYLTASDVAVLDSHNIGIDVWADADDETSVITLTDVRIAGTRSNPEARERSDFGPGLMVKGNAQLTARRLEVTDNERLALAVAFGAQAHVSDCSLSASVPDADGHFGRGVQVDTAGRLTLERCEIADVFEMGVVAGDPDTTLTLSDTTITRTRASADPELAERGGIALTVVDGAMATMTGGGIADTVGNGVVCAEAGSSLELRVVTISDTRATDAGYYGRGLTAGVGAHVLAEDVTISESTEVGAIANGADAHLELLRSEVTRTRVGRDSNLGYGALATGGGTLVAKDSRVTASEGPGLAAYIDGTARATDTELSGNRFAGAAALVGGVVELERARVIDNVTDPGFGGGMGVYANGNGTASAVTLTDTAIGPHAYGAVWLDGPGGYRIHGSDLTGGTGAGGRSLMHGNALVAIGVGAWDGLTGLEISGSTLHDSPAAAVLLEASSMRQAGNIWRDNASDVLQQRCTGVTPLDDATLAGVPRATICPSTNVPIDTSIDLSTIYVQDVELME